MEDGCVDVRSAIKSVLAHVHGTRVTGGMSMTVPDSGLHGSVTSLLIDRNCMTGTIIARRSGGGTALAVRLGCFRNGTIVRAVRHFDHPNLHRRHNGSTVPAIGRNVNITVMSADRNVVDSHTTHTTNVNNRVITFMTWTAQQWDLFSTY